MVDSQNLGWIKAFPRATSAVLGTNFFLTHAENAPAVAIFCASGVCGLYLLTEAWVELKKRRVESFEKDSAPASDAKTMTGRE